MAFDILTYAMCKRLIDETGGGGMPSDYPELKESVAKNTNDITALGREQEQLSNQVATLQGEVESLDLDSVVKTADLPKLIKVADKELTPAEDGSISIPYATTEQAGVVKLSDNENGVGVNSQAELEVNSLNLEKINQHDDDELILKS